MIRRLFVVLLLAVLGGLFLALQLGYVPDAQLNQTAAYYAEHGAGELGAANLVTAIIVTYRGLDTLGEVTVLFLATTIIGLVLATGRATISSESRRTQVSELLTTGSRLLAPPIMLLGVYVFINGHLTPGGGFQGGAILASSALLLLLAEPLRDFSHSLIATVEALSGSIYVLLGLFGLVFAGGFLDNRFLPLGTFGELFSAGAIPLIYSLIGLKVGAEFSSVLVHLSATDTTEEQP